MTAEAMSVASSLPPVLQGLKDKVMANPNILKDMGILQALVNLKFDDPLSLVYSLTALSCHERSRPG